MIRRVMHALPNRGIPARPATSAQARHAGQRLHALNARSARSDDATMNPAKHVPRYKTGAR